MKKKLALILSLLMAMAMIPQNAFADEEHTALSDSVMLIAETVSDEDERMEFALKISGGKGSAIDLQNSNVSVKPNRSLASQEQLACVYVDENGTYKKAEITKKEDETYTINCGGFDRCIVVSECEANRLIRGQKNERIVSGVRSTSVKLSSRGTAGAVCLEWAKSYGYKLDYYEIYRAESKAELKACKAPCFESVAGNSRTFKDLRKTETDKKYVYRIRGVRVIDGKPYYTKYSNIVNPRTY